MDIPFEILGLFSVFIMSFAIIGLWKKIPYLMLIGGILLTFLFIQTDNIIALGDTENCSMTNTTSTCIQTPYPLDMWVKILFMLVGSSFIIVGALVWKTNE